MKCRACGFDEDKVDNYDAGFLEVIQRHPVTLTEKVRGQIKPKDRTEIDLYICPNCGTVRAKHYLIPD